MNSYDLDICLVPLSGLYYNFMNQSVVYFDMHKKGVLWESGMV